LIILFLCESLDEYAYYQISIVFKIYFRNIPFDFVPLHINIPVRLFNLHTVNEKTLEKLKILAGAAKYDVSCASSGTTRGNSRSQLGTTSGLGNMPQLYV